MIPSNVTRAVAVALSSTFGLARHRIGMLAALVALSAAVAHAQVGEAPPKPIFADNAPVIPQESLSKVSLPNTTIDSVEAQRRRRVVPRQSDRDASPDGVSGQGVRCPAHEGLEWEIPRHWWRGLSGRASRRFERAGTLGIRDRRHRHWPRRG